MNKENNKNYYKIITNYEKYDNDLIIDNKNMYTYNRINDNKKRNNKKITIDTNYYNFMKNIQRNLNSSISNLYYLYIYLYLCLYHYYMNNLFHYLSN